ncbi:hypothetical protein VTO42DRAFT_3437 [Malbranchea cinnamomea]
MRNHMAAGWFYSPAQMKRYFATRITSLKPPKNKLRNPYDVLRELNRHQWLMFWVGFLAWTWDSFDYFTVSLCVTEIAEDFGVSNSDVTWGMTVTLMLRSVGALTFGIAADRYGRKWPMIINLGLFVVLELGSAFCQNLSQFLGVRSLYGIAMGGLFGPAAATALEDLPYDARGFLSGLFEMGYATGYLLCAVFYRALVPTTAHGWRSLFWFGSGPPILIIAMRWYLPETNHFQAMKAEREARIKAEEAESSESSERQSNSRFNGLRAFLRDANQGMRENWVIFVYLVVIMTGFNSCSHGSQDFYPTFLKNQVGMSPTKTTIVTVVGQLGSFTGGTVMGYISTFLGRRLTMILCCIFGGAVVPSYILPRSDALIASSFFNQFFAGGVWGPIPIHLSELSPQSLRGLLVGLTYQLGNLASSASATIQATIGERYPLPNGSDGTERFDYGKVIGIFMGSVWVFLFILLLLGPEMSQEERMEEERATRELFELQRQGKTMAQIGTERALLAQKVAAGEATEDSKPVAMHLDIESGGAEIKDKGSCGKA